jgi:hypothetical protein
MILLTAALPLLFFVLLLADGMGAPNGERRGFRRAFLVAALGWGVAVTFLTELLSAFGHLERTWLALGWLIAVGTALARLLIHSGARAAPRALAKAVAASRPRAPADLLLLVGVGLILATTCVIALAAQPNNWDSMTYHLSRVAQWASHRDVTYYPTYITRQLFYPPWAELAIAHSYVLGGSDRLANLVQWFSFVGCILGTSLVAKRLGAGARGQIAAGAFCATIPMAILQASSTQNDLVVAFWLVCLAYWVVEYQEKPDRRSTLGVGVSLGLALLTKFSAYFYVVPWVIWFAVASWRRHGPGSWRSLTVVGLCVAAVNLGYAARNVELLLASNLLPTPLATHQPSPAAASPQLPAASQPDNIVVGRNQFANRVFGVRPFASNVIRNLSVHLTSPFGMLDPAMELGIMSLLQSIDADPIDPRTTFGTRQFQLPRLPFHEDLAPNPLHLAAIATAAVLTCRRRRAHRLQVTFLACLLGAAVIFCLVLKWQPWHSRLHTPLFILGAVLVGVQIERWLTPRASRALLGVLLLAAIPWVVANHSRPLFGDRGVLIAPRVEQLFFNRPELRDHYVGAAAFVASSGCDHAGLAIGGDDWDYPFWVLLADGLGRPPQIEHAWVTNLTAVKEPPAGEAAAPCAILTYERPLEPTPSWRGAQFEEQWSSGPVRVLMRRP